ncbi:MAG: hypothetical protein KW802_04105 [Candidatus Doudnabacteria bacterium]|nr:hypothetical protein [Candidatus Doudnabacteria bacterium]
MNSEQKDLSSKDTGMCPHGNFPATCAVCKEQREQQPALKMVDKLVAESKYSRSNVDSPNATIERDGQKFSIEAIESRENKDLNKVQKLLVDTFGKEEVDPVAVLKAAVEGKTSWNTEDITKYAITVLKDEKGKVQSMIGGGLLELQKDGKPTGEATFMIGYAVTSKDARQGGLAREAYVSALLKASQEAQTRGLKLVSASGECTGTSEKFWNSIGWKRAYGEQGDPNKLEELKYVQPALDFSEKTGKVAKDAGVAPEHLMLDNFTDKPLTKEQALQTVEAFYRWCNQWPREAFKSDEAYKTHLSHVNEIKDKFQSQLNGLGELKMMSAAERAAAMQSGTNVTEHKDADKNTEDKEGL